MDKISAVYLALEHVIDWGRDHQGETLTLKHAIVCLDQHDYACTIDDGRKLLVQAASRGEDVPQDVIALIELAEGTLAAQAIQDGMQSISMPAGK